MCLQIKPVGVNAPEWRSSFGSLPRVLQSTRQRIRTVRPEGGVDPFEEEDGRVWLGENAWKINQLKSLKSFKSLTILMY